jgi:hypothetical protein
VPSGASASAKRPNADNEGPDSKSRRIDDAAHQSPDNARDGAERAAASVDYNSIGYPLRPSEKDCDFFVKNGSITQTNAYLKWSRYFAKVCIRATRARARISCAITSRSCTCTDGSALASCGGQTRARRTWPRSMKRSRRPGIRRLTS